jgi:hypothetical protein
MGHKLECEKKEWWYKLRKMQEQKQHDHLKFLNSKELISIMEVPNVYCSKG